MDNVQNCDNYINIASSQTYRSQFYDAPQHMITRILCPPLYHNAKPDFPDYHI
jgi:hypothetical protein